MLHLSPIDWIVLGFYLALVGGIAFAASRKIKGTDQYFLGSRRFGRIIMIAQSFGTGTHAEMPVSLAGAVYSTGVSGIWYQWKNLFVTPFYWILAPLFRRFRRTTTSEVVEDRYGPWVGGIYTLFALGFFAINLASMLKGAAKVIDQSVGGTLPVNTVLLVMAAIFIVYSFVGGLVATAWTDLVQGLLIISLSFMLVPIGWKLVDGLGGIRATLGADKLSLVTPSGIGVGFILILTLNGLIGIIAQPHLIASVGTGKDEKTCRVGQFYGTLIKRICTVGWALVGLITATLIARGSFGVTRLADPEEAFGFACRHLLFPGGIGLLVACFLAANMAGCSAFMVDSGALVTNGLYRKYVMPSAADRHYLWVGRLSGLIVTLAAVAYAVFLIDQVLYSFLLT
jgi:Na+/proline symporter